MAYANPIVLKKLGKYLSSQRANPQVLSAYRDLTSGFGMGPGVSP